MADSVVLGILVGGPTIIEGFYATPLVGGAPLTVTMAGWLKMAGPPSFFDPACNGESIQLQYSANAINWITGTTFTTVTDSDGHQGAFWGQIILSSPGTWYVRAHYGGNATKGLTGCEKDTATVQVGLAPQIPLVPIAIGGVALVAIILLLK